MAMKFVFHLKGDYKIGSLIRINGSQWVVESRSYTGKNLIVRTPAPNASGQIVRMLVILTDEPPIAGVTGAYGSDGVPSCSSPQHLT